MIKIPILRESLDFYWLDDSIYVKTSLRHEEHWLEPQFKVLTHKTWCKQAFWLKWETKMSWQRQNTKHQISQKWLKKSIDIWVSKWSERDGESDFDEINSK